MSLQMWIDILAAYCYSLAGDDFNWVQVTNKLLCSAATGWNFTVTVVCCRTAVLLLCFVIFEIQTFGILTQLSLLMLLGTILCRLPLDQIFGLFQLGILRVATDPGG